MEYPGSLHNHTDFSNFRLRDAISTIDGLIDYSLELGQEVIAFTEHETLANSIKIEEYYDKIKANNPNFKVIRGNEIYLVRNGLNKDNFDAEKIDTAIIVKKIVDTSKEEKIYDVSYKGSIWTALSNELFEVGDTPVISSFKGNKIILKK